jgi:hypothetical protein
LATVTRGRAIIDRLSYANVAATIALFISLGGVSYAAIVLPANSVGARQLKEGAVTPRALSFPIGVAGVTDARIEDLGKSFCNAPNPPGHFIAGICAYRPQRGVRTPGHEVELTLHSPGRLLVSTIVGLHDEGPAGTRADVTIHVVVDGRLAGHSELALMGGEGTQTPAQLLVSVGAGRHSAGVDVEARYSYYQSGDVLVYPVSVIASALPAGKP